MGPGGIILVPTLCQMHEESGEILWMAFVPLLAGHGCGDVRGVRGVSRALLGAQSSFLLILISHLH